MWVMKLLISQVKKRFFAQKRPNLAQNWNFFGQFGPGHEGLFGALLVGRLVVVARGLYLARHLFTLFNPNDSSNLCLMVNTSPSGHSDQTRTELSVSDLLDFC